MGTRTRQSVTVAALTLAVCIASTQHLSCGGIAVVDGAVVGDGGGNSTTTSSSSSSSTTSSPAFCDADDCSTCRLSNCVNTYCQEPIAHCPMSIGNDEDCFALSTCINSCFEPDYDPACVNQCAESYSEQTIQDAEAVYDCVLCDACRGDCAAEIPCPFEL